LEPSPFVAIVIEILYRSIQVFANSKHYFINIEIIISIKHIELISLIPHYQTSSINLETVGSFFNSFKLICKVLFLSANLFLYY